MDKIKLPDGRIIELKPLLKQVKNRANHNLKSKKTVKIPNRIKNPDGYKEIRNLKYSLEERKWQAAHSWEEISERYGLTEKQAKALHWQAGTIIKTLQDHNIL
jgi:hypothetical protein